MFLEHWIQNLNKLDVYLLEKHHTLPAYISFNLNIIQIKSMPSLTASSMKPFKNRYHCKTKLPNSKQDQKSWS